MLGNRSTLNKQRRQASQQNTAKPHQPNNPTLTQPLISPFASSITQQPPNYLQLPLQMRFWQEEFDEEKFFRELLQEVELGEEGCGRDGERVVEEKIQELDELVDFKWRDWVVEECLEQKIREEIEQIWEREIQADNYQGKQIVSKDNNSNQNAIKQLYQPTDQTPTIQQFLKNTNLTTTELISHIDILISQNQQLTQKSITQQTQLTQRQTELHIIKDKYLLVLKEFTHFKQQSQHKYQSLSSCLQNKQNEIIQFKERVKQFDEDREVAESKMREMKENHQQKVNSVSENLHQYYQFELLHFIAILNGLIVDCQKPLVTLFDPNNLLPHQYKYTHFKPSADSQSIEFSPSTSISQIYQQKLNQISIQLDSFLQQKLTFDHQLISRQSSKIKSLKDILTQSHELIKETNSLSQYELKVEKKDLKQSEMSKSINVTEIMTEEETFELMEEIVEVIKKQILNQAKKSQNLVQKMKSKDNQIAQLQDKINQMNLAINSSVNSHIQGLPLTKQMNCELVTSKKQQFHKSKQSYHSRIQYVSQRQSPIQMLNHNQQSEKLSVNKSTHHFNQQQNDNQVQEFSASEEQILPQVVAKSFEEVKTTSRKSINKVKQQQLSSLKQQNQSLKQQLQILKAELENHLTTQKIIQSESKPATQRTGKIKKTFTNNPLNKLKPTINPQDNKQNIISSSNKLLQPTQSQSANSQKCSNPLCKQLTKKLETKINQYKENIVNLNEIINYFVNHLKGYHFANLSIRAKYKNCFEKNHLVGKRRNFFSVIDSFGNTVRKYSYLDDQLESITRQQQLTQQNFRLNTIQSLNQTVKSTVLSQNINPKQVGKITSIHHSLSNTQTLPIIKPHFSQQYITAQTNKLEDKRSKLISRETLKTNFENFEFIRKLCLKQVKCKDLIAKFHSYLDFYFEKIEEMHSGILDWRHENQMDASDTIELENICNIWQDDEIPTFEPQNSQNASNHGLKVRSINSSHRIS